MIEPPNTAEIVVPLHEEEFAISRQRTERVVRVRVETTTTEHPVDEPVLLETVEVEHVPVGRTIDSIPPIRTEGDTTIVPVVQEELIILRRLILKEEIHLRRVQRTERHREIVTLRQQQAVVERTGPEATGISHLAPQPEPLEEETPTHGI
jgi:stress response protein YsnF